MSTIEIKELTFGYDAMGDNLFDEASLIIDDTWKLGLIGRNGRGKTTLLRLLMGELPYSGKITHQLSFTYFPQPVKDKTQLTFYVLQDVSTFEQWEIERELNLLQVSPDVLWRPFDSLSGGEQTKVLLALLFVDDVNFPLIDEPTNHLDIVARKQVAEYLQKKKQGFIVVSHDRSFVDEVVDHVLAIEKSQLVLYQGNFSVYEEEKARRDKFEQEENVKLKKEISRLKRTAAEKAEWSRGRERDKYGSPTKKGSGAVADTGFIGARAARTMKRGKTLEHRMTQQISEKEALLKDIDYVESLRMNYQPTHRKLLIKAEQFQLSFDGKPLFSPVSFELYQGQRLAIQGANGSGKSSIINYLMGNFQGEATGTVTMSKQVSISFIRQNYEDNHGLLADFAERNRLSYQDLLYNLRKLGLERSVFDNRIEAMSMGQRKRVEVAKSLLTSAELFIWDEPLNYLDVFNQEQLETLIQKVQPTMLVVEHDAMFLQHIATEIIHLT